MLRPGVMGASAGGLVAALLLFTGCSDTPKPAGGVDQALLEGLPAEVVEERLSDPVFLDSLRTFEISQRSGVVQLQVASTVFCRDLFGSYQSWILTGVAPQAPSVLSPTHPEPGFDDFMDTWVNQAQSAIDEGDPASLKNYLLLELGCREVNIDPQSQDQETIADALQG